ncbi:Arginine deiminase [Candidatus Anstonella stagnisolia]|nr:Arginine deiminase [Candidatus Anstonella stagnisolia]
MGTTALQKPSSTKLVQAPGIILPGNGWRAPDARARELTKYFLDSIETTQKDAYKDGYNRKFLGMLNPEKRNPNLQPMLESIFSGEGERYLSTHAARFLADALEKISICPNITVVDEIDVSKLHIWRTNEWQYKSAVVSLPTDLDWATAINAKEQANMGNKPDRFLAVMQHILFIHSLVKSGMHVFLLRPREDCPEMVFTRDVLLALHNKAIRGNMVADVRKNEQALIKNAIEPPPEVQLEFGNVFLEDKAGNFIIVGVGDRTNMAAVEWLQSIVGSDLNVIPIHLKKDILHLDCVFSQIGRLIYPDAFVRQEDVALLQKLYGPLSILDAANAKMLLGNLISIHKALYVSPNEWLIDRLGNFYPVAEMALRTIDLGEITKADGAHRCSTAPLL